MARKGRIDKGISLIQTQLSMLAVPLLVHPMFAPDLECALKQAGDFKLSCQKTGAAEVTTKMT